MFYNQYSPIKIESFLNLTWVSVYPILIVIKESLDVWRVTHSWRMHLPIIHPVYPRTSVVHASHHAEDGEVVSGLITLAASLILVIYDILPDITVDVLVTEGWSTSPVDGHHDDDSQDYGQSHKDTCKLSKN